ncbi:hypothetical protein LCL97_21385 [Seohaeicola saemankumensis]|nr:hypothetical protein [Seohaeicola saemankumensis]MCA0873393.1 hypothetical protein [Seohaeicola saemankumensis]
MIRPFLASLLVIGTIAGAQAQTTAPSGSGSAELTPREAYQRGRALLDQLIMERKIVEAVTIFDPNEAMSRENLAVIEADLRTRYTEDFEHAAVVRSELMRNGFRQELIAYWTGNQYLYVYLLMHTFENRTQLLNFAYNSSFEELNGRF